MVHTFLLTLFFFPYYFLCWMSLAFLFILLFPFRCVVLLVFFVFLCYGSFRNFTALVLLQFLQQRKVSSAKQHEYDWSTSSFILIFANIGFLFPLRSFAFAARACLAPCTVLTFYIFNPISHLHVILHTSLPSYQLWMSNVPTLWTHVSFVFLPPSL